MDNHGIYTRDGHLSVQLMYPKSAGALSNEYVDTRTTSSFRRSPVKPKAAVVCVALDSSSPRSSPTRSRYTAATPTWKIPLRRQQNMELVPALILHGCLINVIRDTISGP
jgi:hypothetical protein